MIRLIAHRSTGLLAVAFLAAVASQPAIAATAPMMETGLYWTGLGRLEGTLRHVGNLRIGSASGLAEGRPEMCLEISPWQPIALEACGNGAGFLHSEDRPEIAHFRVRWRVLQWALPGAVIEPQIGAGFAELQIGEDAPGFAFGRTAGGVSTAGPEAVAAIRALWPVGGGIELLADLAAGAAWLPAADQLAVAQPVYYPFAAFSIGFGF